MRMHLGDGGDGRGAVLTHDIHRGDSASLGIERNLVEGVGFERLCSRELGSGRRAVRQLLQTLQVLGCLPRRSRGIRSTFTVPHPIVGRALCEGREVVWDRAALVAWVLLTVERDRCVVNRWQTRDDLVVAAAHTAQLLSAKGDTVG